MDKDEGKKKELVRFLRILDEKERHYLFTLLEMEFMNRKDDGTPTDKTFPQERIDIEYNGQLENR